MDLSIKQTNRSAKGSQWLGSTHGVDAARPVTLKASSFTDKLVPSGQPLALDAEGFGVPFAEGATLAGFLLDGLNVTDGDASGALLDHGRIRVENLPVPFTAPADAGAFVFVKEG